MTCEEQARENIGSLLVKAGWKIPNPDKANIFVGKGVAIRKFALKSGHGFADYLLYVDGKVASVVEAKKAGAKLSGVEIQLNKYVEGLPEGLPAWRRLLPFAYQSPVPKSASNMVSIHETESGINTNLECDECMGQSILMKAFTRNRENGSNMMYEGRLNDFSGVEQ